MSLGGIRDHLGGGFHRYSIDRYWQIPHFEKMLYDNGQLAGVYAEAYELTRPRGLPPRQPRDCATFVLREMTDAGGGFYAALDAESEGEEGKFYRWDKAEVQKLLIGRGVRAVRRRSTASTASRTSRRSSTCRSSPSRWPRSPRK